MTFDEFASRFQNSEITTRCGEYKVGLCNSYLSKSG
jgi:hypothetical protein